MPEIPISALDARLQKQVENARFAIDRGNLQYAIEICISILDKAPGCLPVRKLLRAAQIKQVKGRSKLMTKTIGGVSAASILMTASSKLKKDPSKALEAAEKALIKDPSNVASHKLLAQAAKALQLHETAAFAWECIRDQAPENIQNLLGLGYAYIDAGRGSDAMAVGEIILRIQPRNPDAHDLMKNASVASSLTKGRWEEETSTYREKLKDEKEAVSLEQAAKFVAGEDATEALINQAIERVSAEPENLNHYRTIINGYKALGDIQKALQWLNKARQTSAGSTDATLAKHHAELRLKMLESNIAQKEAELSERPDDEALRQELEQLQRTYAKARVDEAQSLVDRYPNDQGYRFELGRLLYETGDYDRAISQFQNSQRNPKVRLASLTYLGACFKAKKHYDMAVEQLTLAKSEIAAMNDQKKEITYQLGECYEAMGKREKAIGEYKQIYAADIEYRDVARKIDDFYSTQ